ncbi:type I pullulanase [Metabacillus sp. KIGAM252]|uniref:Type I pullulanase n=1 Tax=Metabacillus flavus TaxID=2823519 RepID=A0ABS5LHU4_9BACI|nr:type I pullulanase [Metabacillus flavus]MBS2970068.1 type I pullulanase [Metabacillus flavus]
MTSVNSPFEAYLDDLHTITILLPSDRQNFFKKSFTVTDDEGNESPLSMSDCYDIENFVKCICHSSIQLKAGKRQLVTDSSGLSAELLMGAVIRTAAFDELYGFDGKLGAEFTEAQISLKVWVPTAVEVRLLLSDPARQIIEMPMRKEDQGIWRAQIGLDQYGKFYKYRALINGKWREAADPYVKAVTKNGEWGVLLNPADAQVDKIPVPPLNQVTDAIIYELHVRDFSIHENSGMSAKGKYKAFAEKDTASRKGFSSGMSYIKSLGVTHVELLPVYDFEGVAEGEADGGYNWGYNPVHFNAPEGSYSTDPDNPMARIRELKECIQALHANGLKMIMDGVYNHVYDMNLSSFEKLVPGYFFRMDEYGYPSNGTGVGNDFASERRMARKYILDSIRYWIEEYDVDGIRFDLMGILDLDTMRMVRELTSSIKKDAILLGEGWDLSTPLGADRKTTIINAKKIPGVAFFNDRFRDVVKGSTFLHGDRGFSMGDEGKKDEALSVIKGIVQYSQGSDKWLEDPSQSVNYVESHDNHTFWDKLKIAVPDAPDEKLRQYQKLASSMVILSQGIPFLHAGQEFYRTKQGCENSYNQNDDINHLDWNLREAFEADIEEIRQLIHLRKSHGAFRLSGKEKVERHFHILPSPPYAIYYLLKNVGEYGSWSNILVIHQAWEFDTEFALPDEDEWEIAYSPGAKDGNYLAEKGKVKLKNIGTYVLFKS